MNLELQALDRGDVKLIAELAARHHSEGLQPDIEELADAFEAAQDEQGNFSLGLLDGERLHGYILAWLEDSRLQGAAESVLLIEDVVVDAAARPHLPIFLRSLLQNVDGAGLGHLAVESAVVRSMQSTFDALQDTVSNFGYELVGSHQYYDAELGEEVTWVRFERPRAVEASINEEEAFVPTEEEFQ